MEKPKSESGTVTSPAPYLKSGQVPKPMPAPEPEPGLAAHTVTLRLAGTVPPEIWNRLGAMEIPKLRSGANLTVGITFSVTLNAKVAHTAESELRQILTDLGLESRLKIEQTRSTSP
jgi:hypothetical protein